MCFVLLLSFLHLENDEDVAQFVQMTQRSEDEVGAKIDRCFADSALKLAGGVAIGIVASVAFFKGRTWPIWFGSGVGIGAGWSNCRHDLSAPFLLHGKKVQEGVNAEPVFAIKQQ